MWGCSSEDEICSDLSWTKKKAKNVIPKADKMQLDKITSVSVVPSLATLGSYTARSH